MPPDGRMLWVFESRGPLEKLSRILNAQKFFRTLSQKLDKAERDWKNAHPDPEFKKEFIEHEPDGSEVQRLLGGAIQTRYKFFKRDDDRQV